MKIALTPFSSKDLPKSFDARKRWISCPTISKVLNSGKCKCGWVYYSKLNISNQFK